MVPRSVLVFFLFVTPGLSLAATPAPRDLLNALNALHLEDAAFTVSPGDRIELRQPDVALAFEQGKIAFLQPYEGRITGFVFSGLGHVLSLPRDSAEKQQMARFTGAPVLDQRFVSALVRFTDDTAEDLLAQLNRAGLQPSADPAFAALWRPRLDKLNPTHSLRILFEAYSTAPRHFFHASLDGAVTGPFDILTDNMRPENRMTGQSRRANNNTYYDVWNSYVLPGSSPPKVPFDALRYQIDTSIHTDNSLEGSTTIDFRALAGTEQILFVELARALKVESISLASGEPLTFFQNEGLTERELRAHGNDTLSVFLPRVLPIDQVFSLRFRYRGNVIEDAGNGVLFVAARESWYPHYGDASEFAQYEMTLRWPKRLRLVATGEKISEEEDGDFRVGRWKTSLPVSEAGFNLGEYAAASITSGNHTIDVYANKQLEAELLARLTRPLPNLDPRARVVLGENPAALFGMQPPTPSPADALKQLARDVDASVRFYEQFSGPFPFRHLGVSQIPGTFGQGWPGLLYLSTISFLPQEAQQRAGIDASNQELFTRIVPFHEVAHQWWGNVVGWSSYRDQWIDESIANYLSLLFADSQKNPEHTLRAWLERYRKQLANKSLFDGVPPADIGPLTMGSRLSSSKSPDAYDAVIYTKGSWVIHMLREMLRQPNSREPDARFIALLHTLDTRYAQRAFSTEQFQKEVEAVMTPKMDIEGGRSMEWFFEEYVRGTGIPRYRVEFTSRRTEKGFLVRGKLLQSGVPRSFVAPVPLYAAPGAGKSVFLGTVLASGEETSFSFTTQADPRKLLIDPRMTLLCIPE